MNHKDIEQIGYHRTQMQKELVIQKLRERGCRITKQRLLLLDIILEEDCSCCKEIYYRASKLDHKIGAATVYRMVNTLEDIGAISRRNMYRVVYDNQKEQEDKGNQYIVEFEDGTTCHLSAGKWNKVLQAGLESCGYFHHQKIATVTKK